MDELQLLFGHEVRNNGAAWVVHKGIEFPQLEMFREAGEDFPTGVLKKGPDGIEYDAHHSDHHAMEALRKRLDEIFTPSLPGFYSKLHFFDFGARTDIEPWHNDYGTGFPGHNVTINCFFDDADEKTGGAFEIKHAGTGRSRLIYPRKNSIIIFNQNKEWLHRVTPSNHLRRVVSYAAFVPSLV